MTPPAVGALPVQTRLRRSNRGGVQGVGFRPFVYRLAAEEKLAGWISNSAQGVQLEVEGEPRALAEFQARLTSELPPRAFAGSLESVQLEPAGYTAFEVRPSSATGTPSTVILPDAATCADCVTEIFDLRNRRHRYPFTNCTRCGPRYSILERLPYDRPHTTMKGFPMCEPCRGEYKIPGTGASTQPAT